MGGKGEDRRKGWKREKGEEKDKRMKRAKSPDHVVRRIAHFLTHSRPLMRLHFYKKET